LNTLKGWCARYAWQARADLYDAQIERRKTERAERIMQSGLALDHERVQKLKRLARVVEGQLYEQAEDGRYRSIWLPDVKQIGSGDNAERVDLEKFNAAIIEEFRGVLDDLAKETGGRKVKQEITSVVEVTDIRDRLASRLNRLAGPRDEGDVPTESE